MAREELQAASERLREAATATGEEAVEERLYEQSRQLAELAAADRGPDHGRLARHENALHEIADDDERVRDDVEEALAQISAYRETVDGV